MRLTSDHQSLRESVDAFVEKDLNPYCDEWESTGMFPAREVYKKAAAIGLLGLEYDPAYGGSGADNSFMLVACEALGKVESAGVSLSLGVQMTMATPSLHRYGTPELKEEFLAPAIAGEAIAAIGVTEPDAGSDVASLRTFARRDGDDWIINGRKMFITNGIQADWICLLTRTSDEGGYQGMSQIVVPTNLPGFSVAQKLEKLGNRASDTAELVFEDVRVPVRNTIGEIGRGFQQQMQQFVTERVFAAYTAVGQCQHALDRTREWMRQRHAFGSNLAKKQYLAFKISELQTELDLLRSHNLQVCESLIAGEDVTRGATIAKLKAGRLSRIIADECLQMHGGMGYMEETWTARLFRDARLTSIGAGSDEVMLQVLSRLDGLL